MTEQEAALKAAQDWMKSTEEKYTKDLDDDVDLDGRIAADLAILLLARSREAVDQARPDLPLEARKDTARLEWFFGQTDKTAWLETYMRGARERWTVDQWRAAIDAAMKGGGRNDT